MPNATARQVFSLQDANRVLPLVRSIVQDVVSEFSCMREASRERRSLEVAASVASHAASAESGASNRASGKRAAGAGQREQASREGSVRDSAGREATGGESAHRATAPVADAASRLEDLKTEVNERSLRIDGFVRELESLGVEVKNLEHGQVEFPSARGGRAFHYCWQLGEASISHFRAEDETFEDRRPVPAADPRAQGGAEARGDDRAGGRAGPDGTSSPGSRAK